MRSTLDFQLQLMTGLLKSTGRQPAVQFCFRVVADHRQRQEGPGGELRREDVATQAAGGRSLLLFLAVEESDTVAGV